MYNRSFSLVSFAGVLILAIAYGGDNPAAPDATALVDPTAPLTTGIKTHLAVTESGESLSS